MKDIKVINLNDNGLKDIMKKYKDIKAKRNKYFIISIIVILIIFACIYIKPNFLQSIPIGFYIGFLIGFLAIINIWVFYSASSEEIDNLSTIIELSNILNEIEDKKYRILKTFTEERNNMEYIYHITYANDKNEVLKKSFKIYLIKKILLDIEEHYIDLNQLTIYYKYEN